MQPNLHRFFLFKAIKPFRGWIIAQLAVAMVWSVDVSLRPYLIKVMLNETGQGLSLQSLLWPALAYVGMSLLVVINFRLYDFILLSFIPKLKRSLGLSLMKKMMSHSHHTYQNHFSGSLSNKVNDVVNGVPQLIKIVIDQFFSYLLAMVIAVYTVGHTSPKFALLLVSWIGIFLLGCLKFAQSAQRLAAHAAEQRSRVSGQLVDTLSNMLNVRFFKGQRRELHYLKHSFNEAVGAEQQRDRFFMKVYAYQGISFVLLQGISLWWLITGLIAGSVTPGDFALILTINISMIDCLWGLSREIREFAECFGNVTQALSLINNPAPRPKSATQTLVISKGEIIFNQVNFAYDSGELFFNNKSLVIAGGQKVGLVGTSGSGKSTFVNLILRLFELQQGQICIDNQDISLVNANSLRAAIGLIPQDPTLFHRSILENIRYGNPSASVQDVYNAAIKAHADEFIRLLPEGYQTIVGERGIKLSGGQRQRIAIARAILKNSPILILDEATSQLDSLTEHFIQSSLLDLMQQKTTLVVAHRLSTLLQMDRILVFDQGQIIEDGTHLELLAQEGHYAKLWHSQVILPKTISLPSSIIA